MTLSQVFKITAPGLKKLEYFIVVNRWGQVIFRTKNDIRCGRTPAAWIDHFSKIVGGPGAYAHDKIPVAAVAIEALATGFQECNG